MYNVDVYKGTPNRSSAKIRPLTMQRDWMSPATYHCYPLTFANSFGYGIYFEDDISFSWDGNESNPAIADLGKDHIWSGRPEGTVSFDTNLVFKTDENTSILTIPVPNKQIDGATVITSLISSSFFTGGFPIVWLLNEPNKKYFIPAGTDIACIIPISMSQFQDSTINVFNDVFPSQRVHDSREYIDYIHDFADKNGTQPKLYRKGINHLGEKIGSHEIDTLRMKVNYK